MADLTTLGNVKGYLPGVGTTTSQDDLLKRLIAAASAWIRSYLSRDITEAEYTEVLDGHGSQRLTVTQFPVKAVTSCAVCGISVDPAAILVRGAQLVRTDLGIFTRGVANVVVTYTAGYTDVPDDIQQACVELVAWRYRERERVGIASKSLQTGGEVESYQTSDVPANVKTLLNQWRRVVPV